MQHCDFLVPSQALGFYYEEVYNQWMNEMTPLMQQVPYMVLPGNHEAECHSPACLLSTFKKDHLGNYTAFNSRFRMPSAESKGVKSMWYSFDYASVHFTSLSSETDYPDAPSNSYTLTHKNGGFGNQVAWLEEDLKKAAANRANVPWIVVTMHRPIYHLEQVDANGAPTDYSKNLQSAFEELFLKYNVDIVISGHRHRYERQMPIARNAAKTDGVSSDKKTYTNPKAPVYLVSGGAGNIEANELNNNKASWHVVQSKDYGIMNVHVGPKSMQWTYINSDSKKVVDQFTITKN
ncbi:hypothetical protein Poli38472_012041 [Pythium oligandrum]|uniref:Acid phosphatase n=1 Tax=Pythium oligandrum TaxID=41045 RepID=A0A8K1CP56_PYTOL|nr:hypothetical protein Poli38472_012041 [Pythium oligandrum]|eukprot:TMW66925.1 hypothetical protein Poli38472_012041 [Pythium oligandrum]